MQEWAETLERAAMDGWRAGTSRDAPLQIEVPAGDVAEVRRLLCAGGCDQVPPGADRVVWANRSALDLEFGRRQQTEVYCATGDDEVTVCVADVVPTEEIRRSSAGGPDEPARVDIDLLFGTAELVHTHRGCPEWFGPRTAVFDMPLVVQNGNNIVHEGRKEELNQAVLHALEGRAHTLMFTTDISPRPVKAVRAPSVAGRILRVREYAGSITVLARRDDGVLERTVIGTSPRDATVRVVSAEVVPADQGAAPAGITGDIGVQELQGTGGRFARISPAEGGAWLRTGDARNNVLEEHPIFVWGVPAGAPTALLERSLLFSITEGVETVKLVWANTEPGDDSFVFTTEVVDRVRPAGARRMVLLNILPVHRAPVPTVLLVEDDSTLILFCPMEGAACRITDPPPTAHRNMVVLMALMHPRSEESDDPHVLSVLWAVDDTVVLQNHALPRRWRCWTSVVRGMGAPHVVRSGDKHFLLVRACPTLCWLDLRTETVSLLRALQLILAHYATKTVALYVQLDSNGDPCNPVTEVLQHYPLGRPAHGQPVVVGAIEAFDAGAVVADLCVLLCTTFAVYRQVLRDVAAFGGDECEWVPLDTAPFVPPNMTGRLLYGRAGVVDRDWDGAAVSVGEGAQRRVPVRVAGYVRHHLLLDRATKELRGFYTGWFVTPCYVGGASANLISERQYDRLLEIVRGGAMLFWATSANELALAPDGALIVARMENDDEATVAAAAAARPDLLFDGDGSAFMFDPLKPEYRALMEALRF